MKAIALAALAAGLLTGCNLMEGTHQFSPDYKNPVPFSTPWWEKRADKKARAQTLRERAELEYWASVMAAHERAVKAERDKFKKAQKLNTR